MFWLIGLLLARLNKILFEASLREVLNEPLALALRFPVFLGVEGLLVGSLMACGLTHSLVLFFYGWMGLFYKGEGYRYEPFGLEDLLN